MSKYKLLHDYHRSYCGRKIEPIPAGTIFTKNQRDVGYDDLIPYWCYTYQFENSKGMMEFGEFGISEIEDNLIFEPIQDRSIFEL